MTDGTPATPFTSTPLVTNWVFRQGDLNSTNEYLTAYDLPTEVHRDLLKHDKITDPFQDLNELSVRWVSDETWTYRTEFVAPADHDSTGFVTILRFEGLDTFATVFLNEENILVSENMFLEHRIDVTDKLKKDQNVLEMVFDSARKRGLELVERHKDHRFIVHQTEISRGPVRKAQYQWGWDWGPLLLTCGPWKPISIETYPCRLFDVHVQYELAKDLKSAEIRVTASCEGLVAGVSFSVENTKTGKTMASGFAIVEEETPQSVCVPCALYDVELWWPRGYGEQNLYVIHLHAHAFMDSSPSTPLHSISQVFGLRKVQLVQDPDTHGTSFYFRINDIDIFCGGSCWIPVDSFLTRITNDTYRSWVELAANSNQAMVRVWGGGIYEANAFYEAADELGVLVWQDFMFACANYPTYPEYLESVEQEARQNVRRLRNHPSVVVWTGNNEDYQIVERYGLKYDPEDKDPNSWLQTDFPARYLYEYLLPNIVTEEAQGVPYHPSSPFGNGKSTVLKVDSKIGDVHQWNVWHGTMEPYQRLPELGGRFVSEFGMEAYPHMSTLQKCVTRKEDRYPGSMAIDFRNKAIGHERRLVSYVTENFRTRYDLEGFTHLSQIMQADAMSWAYQSWRRQWGSVGNRQCGGVLVWQLNDCWPTMSWAVIDYHLVPKPAYYAIKRTLEPVTINVQRKYKSWTMRPADKLWQRDTGHLDMREIWQHIEFDVWVANSTNREIDGQVKVTYISIKTGKQIGSPIEKKVRIAANGTTEVLRNHDAGVSESQDPNQPFQLDKTNPCIIHTSLYVDSRKVATDVAWPDPIKYLTFEDRGLEVRYAEDKTKLYVSVVKPVKGFVLAETTGVRLSSNGIDVVPGEEVEVFVEGCMVDELEWMYVGM